MIECFKHSFTLCHSSLGLDVLQRLVKVRSWTLSLMTICSLEGKYTTSRINLGESVLVLGSYNVIVTVACKYCVLQASPTCRRVSMSYFLCGCCRSDVSEDEMDEEDIQKIIIVTQTVASHRKHPGGDRTGNFTTRTKITSDLAQAINDGLYFYEQDLYSEISEPSHSSRNVSKIIDVWVCDNG